MTLDLPKNRAEKRRREKELKKKPFDKPVLLASHTIDSTKPGAFNINLAKALPGLSMLVMILRTTPKPAGCTIGTNQLDQSIIG